MWGYGAACLTFEVWDFATPVEIRVSPFYIYMDFIKYRKKELRLANNSIKEIKDIIPASKCKIIGAAAIPMLGKKEIDILVISKSIISSFKKLNKIDYKGKIIDNKKAYLRKIFEDITIEIHLVKPNDKIIRIYGKYINILKRNNSLRIKYEKFKKSMSNLSSDEYKIKKSKFIRENIIHR